MDKNKIKSAILDIACMKISAIAGRGSKKDFVDLYFILKEFSLEYLLGLFEKKYKGIKYQKLHLLKSLVYFEDAQSDPEPDMVMSTDWNDVKRTIEKAVLEVSSK